jgi:hypothetical protein
MQAFRPKVLNVHRRDYHNIGDLTASPFRYFGCETGRRVIDIEWMRSVPRILASRSEPLILGGGGLQFFAEAMVAILNHYKGPIIGWGIGENRPLGTPAPFIPMERFALLGVRDWQAGFDWVPCPSCMAPEFAVFRDQAPSHEFVVYDHRHVRLPVEGLPRLSNACMDFRKVISFLASGETVITNSYHGAYWARLLARRVVVFPFATRLLHMRFPPVIADATNYRQRACEDHPEHGALEICREKTLMFASRVSELLGTELTPLRSVATASRQAV